MRAFKNGRAKFWFKMLVIYSAVIYAQSYQAVAFPIVAAPLQDLAAKGSEKAADSEPATNAFNGLVHHASMRVEIGQRPHLFDGDYRCALESRMPFHATGRKARAAAQ